MRRKEPNTWKPRWNSDGEYFFANAGCSWKDASNDYIAYQMAQCVIKDFNLPYTSHGQYGNIVNLFVDFLDTKVLLSANYTYYGKEHTLHVNYVKRSPATDYNDILEFQEVNAVNEHVHNILISN